MLNFALPLLGRERADVGTILRVPVRPLVDIPLTR